MCISVGSDSGEEEFVWLEQCKTEPGVWRIMQGTMAQKRAGERVEGKWDFTEREEGEGEFCEARTWERRVEEIMQSQWEEQQSEREMLIGWLLAYVDDLLLVSWVQTEEEEFPGDRIQNEIEKHWKCGKS